MTPTSFIDPATGLPLPFNDARWSGLSVGVPGTRRDVGRGAEEVRDDVAQAGARSRAIHVARNGFVDRPDVLRPDRRRTLDWFDDIPATAALYLDPDGTPHDVGTTFRNPDLAQTYELHRAARARRRFYRGAVARRDRRRRAAPADRADRRTTSGGPA